MSKPGQRCALALIFLALVAAASAWWYSSTRFQALAYRPDFGFYHQFAARAGRAELSDRQTYNVQGDNMFGIVGREGIDRLHQAVHFEPIKYLDVLGFRLGGGVGWMFLWRSLVHALPLIFLWRATRGRDPTPLLGWLGLAYVLFPSFLFHATFDLRPYQVLAPALFCLFLAVVRKLPDAWVLAALLLALSAREEALLLAGFGVVLLQLVSPERRRLVSLAGGLWGVWLAITLAYMAWTGYSLQRSALGTAVFAAVSAGALALPLVASRWLPRLSQVAAIVAPAGIVVLALFRSRWAHDLGWLYGFLHPRPFVIVPVLLVLLLWFADFRSRWAIGVAVAVVASSAGIHLLSERAPLHQLGWQAQRGRDAELVFEQKRALDPLSAHVLCDESTCQAFADFEDAFHYNAVFGDAGFPRRGPEDAEIGRWLRGFDRLVVTSHVLEGLEAFGVSDAEGWTIERRGAFAVATP